MITDRYSTAGIAEYNREKRIVNEWRILLLAIVGIGANVAFLSYNPVTQLESEAAYESEFAVAVQNAHQKIALKEQFETLALR